MAHTLANLQWLNLVYNRSLLYLRIYTENVPLPYYSLESESDPEFMETTVKLVGHKLQCESQLVATLKGYLCAGLLFAGMSLIIRALISLVDLEYAKLSCALMRILFSMWLRPDCVRVQISCMY